MKLINNLLVCVLALSSAQAAFGSIRCREQAPSSNWYELEKAEGRDLYYLASYDLAPSGRRFLDSRLGTVKEGPQYLQYKSNKDPNSPERPELTLIVMLPSPDQREGLARATTLREAHTGGRLHIQKLSKSWPHRKEGEPQRVELNCSMWVK